MNTESFTLQVVEQNWQEPASIAEAKERRQHLIESMRDIDVQLAGPSGSRKDLHGVAMDFEEYKAWRHRCLKSKRYKEAEATKLKNWILEAESKSKKGKQQFNTAHRLIRRALHALQYNDAEFIERIKLELSQWLEDCKEGDNA
jgi:hypothetical protein